MVKYSEKLLEYFHERKHAGSLADAQNVYVAETGSVEQGEVIRIYVELDNRLITKVRFKAHGSVALISVSEFVCCWLEGKRLEEVGALSAAIILKTLGLSTVYNHVSVLVLQCVNKSLKGIE